MLHTNIKIQVCSKRFQRENTKRKAAVVVDVTMTVEVDVMMRVEAVVKVVDIAVDATMTNVVAAVDIVAVVDIEIDLLLRLQEKDPVTMMIIIRIREEEAVAPSVTAVVIHADHALLNQTLLQDIVEIKVVLWFFK